MMAIRGGAASCRRGGCQAVSADGVTPGVGPVSSDRVGPVSWIQGGEACHSGVPLWGLSSPTPGAGVGQGGGSPLPAEISPTRSHSCQETARPPRLGGRSVSSHSSTRKYLHSGNRKSMQHVLMNSPQ
ncbi:hypothetical protein AAFF_G00147030 [Aldrovandia affinis]|uniref:Uncharacterized protein n=1 Tax=Aldrovandia affinis TaxID=143900 RepID=A0AAD7RPY5_9TELE|nr:hypothetical protein AAFF_G00147030 [Aldrovandia affinis]